MIILISLNLHYDINHWFIISYQIKKSETLWETLPTIGPITYGKNLSFFNFYKYVTPYL